MNNKSCRLPLYVLVALTLFCTVTRVNAQPGGHLHWADDGYQYYTVANSQLVELDTRDSLKKTIVLTTDMLTPAGQTLIRIENFTLTADGRKVLIFTNSKRVWRYNTRGDYWIYDLDAKTLKQIGKNRPASSLMFAKLSPDGTKAAYVSEHNLYVEDLASGTEKALTTDGTKKLINGTFDWVYEEEFDCRDGFRWSPDSRTIAYWQIDATKIKNYLMLNTTDSTYSFVVPVEYPVAGEDPSSCKLGVVDVSTAKTSWLNVPGDPIQHYIPRMDWAGNSNEIILQQFNRAQNESKLYIVNVSNGTSALIHDEQETTWIDVKEPATGWDWINKGKEFLWVSEKDGWRHIYKIDRDGKETLLTKGNYDIFSVEQVDETGGYIYFTASPDNATQKYLYRIRIKGGKEERITPADEPGTNEYEISPNGKISLHDYSNIYTLPASEVISLPEHKHISGKMAKPDATAKNKPEFFKVTTVDGVTMNGWMVKPTNFDSTKKYPVVFYVYSEPAEATVRDQYGSSFNFLYKGSMAHDGYISISLDNRGTPAPKGTAWRKAIYKNIGLVNIEDQAMGAKEVLKWPFVDTSRVAVWGWSGGGSCTLNLMFQHPEIYKTGIAIAAVGWELTYDNIYQERYMGVPIDDAGRQVFIKGSPITYVKNLRGNLLYIHGTGDDNVHYKNAEMLINELVKYNKQFSLMSYPNRSHGIFEGPGTRAHLSTLYTNYLKEHCPPGGR
jgi:dipeptidyl-peptidase-4